MRDHSRRDFLGQSAAVVGASLLLMQNTSALAADEAAKPRRPWKKAFYGGVEGKTLKDQFQLLKDAGFDGIEINSPTKYSKDEVLETLKATGLLCEGVVDSMHWSVTLSDPDAKKRALAVENLKTAIRDCKYWGGTSVLLVPAVVNKQVSYDDAYKRSQEEIRKAIPTAAEMGVKIAIENVWNSFLLSPVEAARYVDEFESPWVGWHFDIGNIINYGWPEQWARILGKRIVKLHIKEYSRKKRDKEGPYAGFNVELTEGDNDWPAIMRELDAAGYNTWACAEVGGGGLARMKDVAQRMDRILAS